MTNTNLKELKLTYKHLTNKKKAILHQINEYCKLSNSLLEDVGEFGEKLERTNTKNLLIELEEEKHKLEIELVSVEFDKRIVAARIGNGFPNLT